MRTVAPVVLAALLGAASAHAADKLVPYRVVDGGIPKSLTSEPGDPVRGRALMDNRQKGGCLNCHAVPNAKSPGDLAPDLAGVASRQPVAAMRLRLVDPQRIDRESRMPAFYRTTGLTRVAHAFEGKPLLQPQEIEDILAFLATLK